MNQVETNVFDSLLYHLSHVGKISWMKFKETVYHITDSQSRFEYSTYLRNLARLGHVDYDPMNLSEVVIGPSVLVETAIENRYVLVGSRVPGFLGEVRRCISENGGEIQQIPKKYAPTTVVLSELTEEVLSTLESLGIHISREFSAKLSQILPRPRLMNIQPELSFAANLEKKFNPTTLNYEPVVPGTITDGLYQISRYGPDVYVLRSGRYQRRVPRDWAEWYVLDKTLGRISYKKESQTWRVKSELIPPSNCRSVCDALFRLAAHKERILLL